MDEATKQPMERVSIDGINFTWTGYFQDPVSFRLLPYCLPPPSYLFT